MEKTSQEANFGRTKAYTQSIWIVCVISRYRRSVASVIPGQGEDFCGFAARRKYCIIKKKKERKKI